MNGQNQGVKPPNQEDQDEQQRKAAQGGALASIGSGAVRPVGAAQPGVQRVGASSAARAQQVAGKIAGSGFLGAGRVLGANVGSRIGQAVAGRVSGVGQQAQGQLGRSVGQFQTGLSSAQQQLQKAQTGFQQAYSGIMGGTSPYIQQQPQQIAPGASSGGVGGISGAVRAYGVAPAPAAPAQSSGPFAGAATGTAATDALQRLASAPPEVVANLNKIKPLEFLERPISRFDKEQPQPQELISEEPPAEQAIQPPESDATADYAALTQGTIQAPGSLEGLESAREQAFLAEQMGEATRTAGGRSALLREAFGRAGKPYTRGQSALDALVLGKASKELLGARKEAAGLTRDISRQEKTAEAQAGELQAKLKAAGREAQSAVEGSQERFGSEIGAQRQQYTKELDRLTSNLTSQIATGKITRESADILKGLGLDPQSAQLYNLNKEDLSKMIKARDVSGITEASSAKLEQLQKINALRKLSGQEAKYSAEQLAQAGQTVGAGAAKTGIGTTKDFSDVLKAGRSEYEKLVGKIIPGYKGYDTDKDLVEGAKTFKSQADFDKAFYAGRDAAAKLSTFQLPPELDDQTKSRMAPKKREEYEAKRATAIKQRQALQDAVKKGEQASKYQEKLAQMGSFAFSPGRGNTSQAFDVASKLFSGGLYDTKTGMLNKEAAKALKKFYSGRQQYLGKEGMFGAGRYGRYEGDITREKQLAKLLAGAEQKLKIEE